MCAYPYFYDQSTWVNILLPPAGEMPLRERLSHGRSTMPSSLPGKRWNPFMVVSLSILSRRAIPFWEHFCEYDRHWHQLSPLDRIISGIIGRVAAKVGSKVASKAASKAKPHKIAKQAHKQQQNNNNNNNNKKNNKRKHKRDILEGSDYEYQFEREFDDLDVRGFFDDLD